MNELRTENLLDLTKSIAGEHLKKYTYPYEALGDIKNIMLEVAKTLDLNEYYVPEENVYIHKTASVAPSALIYPYTIIGPDTEVRHCAFIRGSVIVGADCVIGNSTELKNCIIFDGADVPHYNYVGDSILGYKAHLGAGAILSNIKSDKRNVRIRYNADMIDTGLRKMGAIIGDYVEAGCNSVLNPGTIVGRSSNIYPTSCVRGFIPANSIFKNNGTIIIKRS